jgi:hypothetical protein
MQLPQYAAMSAEERFENISDSVDDPVGDPVGDPALSTTTIPGRI